LAHRQFLGEFEGMRGALPGNLIVAAAGTLIYLPKYSPDLNPIELAFSKLKAHLRKAAEQPSRASYVGSVALLPISARRNAGISFAMQAMFEPDRNPL
jgi:transposase